MKKKRYILIILVLLVLSNAVFVYASEKEPLEPVPFAIITSDNDDFQPDNEYSITFAKSVTINAETVMGAKVSVEVAHDDSLGLSPVVYDEVTVGATLKFILPVPLRLGDNTIKITVEKEGLETVVIEALIKRKDRALKNSLQNLIIIPSLMK